MAKLCKKTGRLKYTKITSNNVVEAYYVACHKDREYIDDVISLWTGAMPWNWGTPPVSHIEGGIFVDGQLWFVTSTLREYKHPDGTTKTGVRWMKAEQLLKNPTRWIFRSRIDSKEQIGRRIARANSKIGLPYDKVGVVWDFISPVDLAIKKASWYCSKLWHYVDTGEYARISPRRRYRVSKQYNYHPRSFKWVKNAMTFYGAQKPKKKNRGPKRVGSKLKRR